MVGSLFCSNHPPRNVTTPCDISATGDNATRHFCHWWVETKPVFPKPSLLRSVIVLTFPQNQQGSGSSRWPEDSPLPANVWSSPPHQLSPPPWRPMAMTGTHISGLSPWVVLFWLEPCMVTCMSSWLQPLWSRGVLVLVDPSRFPTNQITLRASRVT